MYQNGLTFLHRLICTETDKLAKQRDMQHFNCYICQGGLTAHRICWANIGLG